MNELKTIKVFIVTTGVYSDYVIMCVCSSREIAERFIKDAGYDNDQARIEVYALDHPRNDGFHLYDVEINISTRTVESELHTYSEKDNHDTISWSNDRAILSDDGTSLVWDYMRAKSKEYTAKIANEKVSAMIASQVLIPVPGKNAVWQWRDKGVKR